MSDESIDDYESYYDGRFHVIHEYIAINPCPQDQINKQCIISKAINK